MNVKATQILIITFLACLQMSCGGSGGGGGSEDLDPASEVVVTTEAYIIMAGGDLNHAGVSLYKESGEFEEVVFDLRSFGSVANGIAVVGTGVSEFLLSTNGSDALLSADYSSEYDFFYGSSNLNGNVYDMEHGPVMDYYYVVESNNIEVFSAMGERLASAIIPQNLGACSLSNPRGLHTTEDGYLYVASLSNNRILKYDVGSHIATCEATYDVTGLNPSSVAKHSNGLLYFTSFTDDAVYTLDEDSLVFTNIFDPGLTILRDPIAIVELPNGDLLTSSTITDSIERIDATGVRQGTAPFIQDSNSLNIQDIEVIVR